MTADDEKLLALHERWTEHAAKMLDEPGADPRLVAEAMMTIATASMITACGPLRTAHALLAAYGPVREAAAARDAAHVPTPMTRQ